MAESDSPFFDNTHRSMVSRGDVTIKATVFLGTVDGGEGNGTLFDWIVGDDVL